MLEIKCIDNRIEIDYLKIKKKELFEKLNV